MKILKKIFKFVIMPLVLMFIILAIIAINSDPVKKEGPKFDDPMNIGLDSIKKYEGKKWTYDFQNDWDIHETLEQTNNQYAAVYFEKTNISMVFRKKTKEILFAGFTKKSSNEFLKKYKKDRKKLVEGQLSGWDGRHPGLAKLIKKNMNDPNSFEHIETRYRDEGDLIFITTTFTGKNAFGGRVKNSISARVDFNGNVIEIVE